VEDSTDSHAERLLRAACLNAAELAGTTAKPLRRLRLRDGSTMVELEWERAEAAPVRATAPDRPAAIDGTAEPAGEIAGPPAAYHTIRSPMVGVFYLTPQPGAAAFVQVGDTVVPGQQVAVIEAMKLMVPVEADHPGRVRELLVAPEATVEYGDPLIALEPVGQEAR
jgi:acetyl-CoA carboxylase biotin carboxyl carrier protein